MKKEIVYTDIQLDEGVYDWARGMISRFGGGTGAKKEPAETVGDALKANLESTPATAPTAPAGPSIDPNSPVPLFTGKDPLYQRLMNSIKSRLKQFNMTDSDTQTILAQFDVQIKNVLKDLAAQMKANGLTQKQIQEALTAPAAPAAAPTATPATSTAPTKTGEGGRVQAKGGAIDVRRAVFGKFDQAMKQLSVKGRRGVGGKFVQPIDDATRNKLTMEIIEKIIIPFISQHLSARGFNVTDRKAGRTIPAKNPTGTPKNVTLSESTVNRWKVLAEIKK